MTDGFHRDVCNFYHTTPYSKNLYMLPRYFYKTSMLTCAANVQRILNNPEIRILIGSNKAENAQTMLAEIKGHLRNEWLVWLFPEILYRDPAREAERWTTDTIIVKRTRRHGVGTIETIGVEGELTSKHYDHGTFDDVVGFENSQTRDQLQRTITWMQTAQGLFHPGQSTQDYIGTPWHYADLYAWLQEQQAKGMPLGVYRRPCFEEAVPCGELCLTLDGEPISTFPEEFPVHELLRRKKEQGTSIFTAQMMLNPIDDETAVFLRSKVPIIRRDLIPATETLWIAMTIDPAISMKSWADYSALAVGGFDREGRCYLLDLRRGRWTEDQLIRYVYEAYARTPGIRAIGFEAVSFAKIYRRLFTLEGERRGLYLPVTALERDTRITKGVRIRSLQPFWENGSIILAADLQALEEFLEEAERFRYTKESAHDDMLDAVADLLQLRIRPATKEPESMIDDPEALERQRFEIQMLAQKPHLDRTSLRAAWHIKRRYEIMDQEREAEALGVGPGEFWT